MIGLVAVALGRRARTEVWNVTNVTTADGSAANPAPTGSILVLLSRDPELTHNLDQLLSGAGYATRSRSSVSDVLALANTIHPALVLVDRRVADWDVLRTSPALSRVPFLGLVPDGMCLGEEEHLLDFERGMDGVHEMADGNRLLLAKVGAYLRRAGHGGLTRGVYRLGAVELDSDRLHATVAGVPVKLSAKQFALLKAFMQAPSRVFTRRELFDIVWGPNFAVGDHTLDVHVHAVRQALDRDPLRRCRLLAIKGVGFKLVEDSSAEAVPRLLPCAGGATAPVHPELAVGLSQPRRLPPMRSGSRLMRQNPLSQPRRARRLQPVALRRTVEQAVSVG
jgi:DNA-binding response OmpR family regulator